jgi:hypothetical protein
VNLEPTPAEVRDARRYLEALTDDRAVQVHRWLARVRTTQVQVGEDQFVLELEGMPR